MMIKKKLLDEEEKKRREREKKKKKKERFFFSDLRLGRWKIIHRIAWTRNRCWNNATVSIRIVDRAHGSFDPCARSCSFRSRWLRGESECNWIPPFVRPLSSPPPLCPGETRSIRSPFRRIRRLYVVQKVWRIAWKRGRNYGSSPNSPPNDDVTIGDVDQTRKIDCTWEET